MFQGIQIIERGEPEGGESSGDEGMEAARRGVSKQAQQLAQAAA